MTLSKLAKIAEGLVVTTAGILFLLLSLGIRKNPVTVEGPLNLIIQAKFLPLVLSALITLQGVRLTATLWKGKEGTSAEGGFTSRSALVVLITVAYLTLVSFVGFTIPTVAFIAVLLFVCNRGQKPLLLIALTILYSVLALLVIPGMLNLQLM